MVSKKLPILSNTVPLYLCVLDSPNLQPGEDDTFSVENIGAPPTGTLYIDSNPGELSKIVKFIYRQTGDPELVSGRPPEAKYNVYLEALAVPTPRSFLEIIEKMNEGQFLRLGPNDKGVCLIPLSRRSVVLQYLGFRLK